MHVLCYSTCSYTLLVALLAHFYSCTSSFLNLPTPLHVPSFLALPSSARQVFLGSKSHTRALTGTAPSTSFWSPPRGRVLFWLKGLLAFCFSAAYCSSATHSFILLAQLHFASHPLSFFTTFACATHLFHASIWCLQRIFPCLTAHFTLALASHVSHHI